jgi:hypothetical protein
MIKSIILLISLGFIIFRLKNIRDYYLKIEDNLRNKTVVQVWTHKCKDLDFAWGLGDIIKGTSTMYELSREMGFELIVDTSLHQYSKFLKPRPKHKYSNMVEENKDNIQYMGYYQNVNIDYIQKLRDYIKSSLKHEDVVILYTNCISYDGISPGASELIKDLFTPNEKFQKIIDFELKILPNEFNIIHYRLGDNVLVNNSHIPNFDVLSRHFEEHHEKTDLFITDSEIFKNYIYNKYYDDVNMLYYEIVHSGFTTTDIDKNMDTLIEFFIVSKAKKIKTYTVYQWISGFVWNTHKIYNIPIEYELDKKEFIK